MKDRWINVGHEDDELTPYKQPELYTDDARIGNRRRRTHVPNRLRPLARPDDMRVVCGIAAAVTAPSSVHSLSAVRLVRCLLGIYYLNFYTLSEVSLLSVAQRKSIIYNHVVGVKC